MCTDSAVRSTGECTWREVLPRGRHSDPNQFKYGHKLSLLSAVKIKGCLNQEKFRLNQDQSRGCVSQWERSAVTNTLSHSCCKQTIQQIFFYQSRRKFSQFHPKKELCAPGAVFRGKIRTFAFEAIHKTCVESHNRRGHRVIFSPHRSRIRYIHPNTSAMKAAHLKQVLPSQESEWQQMAHLCNCSDVHKQKAWHGMQVTATSLRLP